MNPSGLFIRRPVATTLLTLGLALAGAIAFFRLPVSPLPQVDYPTIQVSASMPGASPETMASSVGTASIVLQFGLNRDIDGAARDVQAAIVAARVDLPTALRSNPTYRKVNPADAPILILALTSPTLTPGQLYDAAATVLQQKLSQVSGVGQVTVGGSSLPAVRVELNPQALFKYGIGLEDVRAALASANANSPKGAVDIGGDRFQIYTNDQASKAVQYRSMVVAYRDNAAVRLSDLAEVTDSVEDLRNLGLSNGGVSVLVLLFRQPGANIIDTVDRVAALLPELQVSLPADTRLTIANDRTTTIRASLFDVERTLMIAIVLVILVVFVFLRSARATLVPSVAVPVSLIGTFGAMYLLGYSLDNLSLMALCIATGFVVDDAIVVLENVSRHVEAGMGRLEASIRGAQEVGFTVLSMSLSLVAVFLPILLMGGIIGRLFREFAITLSIAVLISLVVSLTTTPMMCALMIEPPSPGPRSRWFQASERGFEAMLAFYARTLRWALRNRMMVVTVLAATIVLNIYLFMIIPKGFFPQQDTGRLMGGIQGDQSISFQSMEQKLTQFVSIVQSDPAVESVVGFTGGRQTNSGNVFVALKPLAQRTETADQVIGRLRFRLNQVAGARLFLQAVQDIRIGGRQSNAQYQFTLQGDDLAQLYLWAPKLVDSLQQLPVLTDVNSDQQQNGLEIDLSIDRDTAARLGVSPSQIDNTLYDAFGQRQVSTIYNPLNQYHVVMEVAPRFWQSPDTLKEIYVSTSGGAVSGTQGTNAVAGTVAATTATLDASATTIAADSARNQALNSISTVGHGSASTGAAVTTAAERMVPLAAFSKFGPGKTPLAVNHQGTFVATTLSFNLAPGESLSAASDAIRLAMAQIGMPGSIHGSFQGTAAQFQNSLSNEPILILAALAAVYIVLGVLYES